MIQAALPPYSIVFEVDETTEIGEDQNVHVTDYQQIIEAIQKLTFSVDALNETLTVTEEVTEEITEEVTEEVTTEEIPVEELPVQKGDVMELQHSVDNLSQSVEKLKGVGEQQLEATKALDTSGDVVVDTLEYLDETVDHHLYLTSEVKNASINDVFTLSLSIRNLLLVFFLFWLSLQLFKLLRTVIERVMNR